MPGQPQHVIQRGNNRTAIFATSNDYLVFRECLLSATIRFGCAIHAYVLMTNHVHLLMTPRDAQGISRALQSLGRRYVRYFNDRYQRTGTLWEGRYRATVIETDKYLFTCCRYIEENPVRAGIVTHASRYAWSSHMSNAQGVADPLITPHERYLALGMSPAARQTSYRALFVPRIDPSTLEEIRESTNHGWALGGERFQRAVNRAGRRAVPLPGGRPRKAPTKALPKIGV
jgi:putative transposase